MFVASSTGSRMAAVAWLAASLLLATPALSQGPDRGKGRRTARPAPTAPPPAPLRDGQAEARLLQVFRLTSEGHHREALKQAERLVRDYPHFQLAQLALGDLLLARSRPLQRLGNVSTELAVASTPGSAAALEELRTESRQRMVAQRIRPPEHSIPSQFLQLAPSYRHAIAVDAALSRLYLFGSTRLSLSRGADVVGAQVDCVRESDAAVRPCIFDRWAPTVVHSNSHAFDETIRWKHMILHVEE